MKLSPLRKIKSLLKYRREFVDWQTAAMMRYRKENLPDIVRLRMRGGGALWVRPKSDPVAMGEIFVAESYGELYPDKPIMRVWDIGGNIGCFAIWALRRQPHLHITSFEPCMETFEILSKNRSEWSNKSWEVRPFGLADRDQSVSAFVPHNSYGQTSRHATSGIPTQLSLRNIATVWEEEGRPAIDLLKIDCEGDEYEILKAVPAAMWNSIATIIMEVHPREGKSPDELKACLQANGFDPRPGRVNPDLWLAIKPAHITDPV